MRVTPIIIRFLSNLIIVLKQKVQWKESIKRAAVETIISHFNLEDKFSKKLQIKEKVIVFSSRAWARDQLPDFIPSDTEIWNLLVHYFSRRIGVFVLAMALYFIFFVWTLRPSVLNELTGMNFFQFIIYPFTAWFIK